LIVSAVCEFARLGTTVNPMRPGRASALVTTGVFARTRNPVYLGFAGLMVAHALARRSLKALAPVGVFVWALDRRQIPAEEAALARRFGRRYTRYRRRVPRWAT
jgi:protein-S-isoprenylcysteine O-methyltransferase Ste14